jgi:hypothetical protein
VGDEGDTVHDLILDLLSNESESGLLLKLPRLASSAVGQDQRQGRAWIAKAAELGSETAKRSLRMWARGAQ